MQDAAAHFLSIGCPASQDPYENPADWCIECLGRTDTKTAPPPQQPKEEATGEEGKEEAVPPDTVQEEEEQPPAVAKEEDSWEKAELPGMWAQYKLLLRRAWLQWARRIP